MATTKRSLNITLAPELDGAIARIAKRDNKKSLGVRQGFYFLT
jgi:hypothetical protein